jgi:DNA polymerase III subunit gamma/tau
MSYLVLARKWRPQTFDEIVGQEHVAQTLTNAIRAGRVAHAFLFTGVRGVGKTTAARVLAKALNCVDGPTPTPCNVCVNCQEITAGNAVDVLEIDGASNTGVDDVREIIENVRYHPAKSRYKIYIIDEVHMLSTSAFNALLKTLEEPPPHVKFIFATTDAHKVPHTIHSRCQRYDFKRIPFQLITQRLAQIARSEEITVSAAALALIAREGEGSMRDAQSLFDQVIAFAGKTIRDEDVLGALGLADRKLLYGTAEAILDHDAAHALELLEQLHLYGYDMRRFARELLEHFRNLAVARLVPTADLLPTLPEEERTEVLRQAQKWGPEDLDRGFRLLLDAETEVGRVSYPKLVLEMTLIKLATLLPVVPVSELLDRLDDLDRRLSGPQPATGSPVPSPERPPQPARHEAAGRPQRNVSVAEPPPDVAASPQSSGRTWKEFLTFVGKEKITLLAYLQSSAPVNCDGSQLVLTVPGGYYYDYLVQRGQTRQVEELASRFFGRPMRVSVQSAEAAPPSTPAPSATSAALHEAALENPVVRAAVEILGGEVQEVRARTRRERGSK